MHPRFPLVALLGAIALMATTPPQAASAKYKECEFSKTRAKKKKAPRCQKDLSRSKWIVVSGEWHEKLTIAESDDSAQFSGQGTADLEAGGLDGGKPFPARREPTVSMISKANFDHLIDFKMTSTGGWKTKNDYYPCGLSYGNEYKPSGFGGIFSLTGRNVRVQWPVGAAGFGCGDAPYMAPHAEFPTPIETYRLASFKNRRLVKLPIAFDVKDVSEGHNARRTIDGVARLRRYR